MFCFNFFFCEVVTDNVCSVAFALLMYRIGTFNIYVHPTAFGEPKDFKLRKLETHPVNQILEEEKNPSYIKCNFIPLDVS